jgi:hypothetical protein
MLVTSSSLSRIFVAALTHFPLFQQLIKQLNGIAAKSKLSVCTMALALPAMPYSHMPDGFIF